MVLLLSYTGKHEVNEGVYVDEVTQIFSFPIYPRETTHSKCTSQDKDQNGVFGKSTKKETNSTRTSDNIWLKIDIVRNKPVHQEPQQVSTAEQSMSVIYVLKVKTNHSEANIAYCKIM